MSAGVLILLYFLFSLGSFVAVSSGRRAPFYGAMVLGLVALTIHGFFIFARGVSAKHFPLVNSYETLILLSFLVMVIYFLTFPRFRSVALGGFSGLITSILLAFTSLLSPDITPLLPSLKSNWLFFHVVTIFIGYASFAVAFGSAAFYLFWDIARFKSKKTDMSDSIQGKLEYLDWLTYRLIAGGFPFLTLGIVTGAVWANICWGSYWSWDPKETWAFITWLIYGACLHTKYTKEPSGRSTALFAFFGFLVMMFTYLGVNLWLASLHTYG